ncbi:MAG: ATP-binding protein [Oscillospiraceae bacterium]|nr:ATP-binding protein [Oscillospiraceae bacterium]
MFVGRDRELTTLNNLYNESIFQMVVIYGRRRVGKTTLISKFISGKPSVFFTAQEVNDAMNLRQFSKKIYSFFNLPESTGAFDSWNSAFGFIADKAKEKQFILAFDDFPYAASANHSLKSILQIAIDHSFRSTGLFLILCGSQVGFMENEVLGYKSPLFGRRTAQIKLEGFDYYDAGKMLSSFKTQDKVKLYACVGGTPQYLSQVKATESFEENIKRLYFDKSGYLYNEPTMLLQQELREPAMYNSIITAIAGGSSRLNEIATKVSEDSPKVSKYLQTLVSLQIINKVHPFGENPKNSRKGIYRIADNCYAFWYKFVFPFIPEIESGNGEIISDSVLSAETLPSFIGKPPFEAICLQYLQRMNVTKLLPITATSFGSWWGADPLEKRQTDFDVIAANRQTGQIILGECKWKENVSVRAESEKLINKEHLLSEYTERHYYLFVKTLMEEKQKHKDTTIVTADMLYDLFNYR